MARVSVRVRVRELGLLLVIKLGLGLRSDFCIEKFLEIFFETSLSTRNFQTKTARRT